MTRAVAEWVQGFFSTVLESEDATLEVTCKLRRVHDEPAVVVTARRYLETERRSIDHMMSFFELEAMSQELREFSAVQRGRAALLALGDGPTP